MFDTEEVFDQYAKLIDKKVDQNIYAIDLYITFCGVPPLSESDCRKLQTYLKRYGYHDDSFFPLEQCEGGNYHFSVMKKYYYRMQVVV